MIIRPRDPYDLGEIFGEEGWAMPSAHSAALRAEPRAASQAKPAAVIAGALRDPVGLFIVFMIGLVIIEAYGVFA